MRNLKKSLALLLALVMVLGLCAINAGAVFGDEDAIDENYAPAVDVMTGMGILKGDDNDGDGVNEFRPEDPVTRAEAAKMITYMMLGEDTAEMLPARAVLDVPETHWASGYINFLYNKGIIDGMGDGTFAASASVTALQYAKMLLCACGYGTKKEYVGTGWDVNVFIDAIDSEKGNIFGDADVADFATPATRQEAAYYTFNALTETEIVTYSDGKYKGTGKYYSGKYGYKTVEGVVLASADTTSNSTAKLSYIDSDKKPAEPAELKFKDGLDKELIGHKVKVVYDTASKKDGVYTAIYSVEDLSTEVSVDTTVKELTKALGGKKYSEDYIYWNNYTKDTSDLGKDVKWGDLPASKTAYDQVDGMNAGCAYILDDKDAIIGFKSVSFTVGTVAKITNSVGAEKISLNISGIGVKVYENNDDTDVIVEYPGIAKGDRVQITQIGDIIYLYKCDIVRVNVTRYSPMKGIINNEYEKDFGNSSKDYGEDIKTKQAYDLYLGENGKWIYAKNMGDIVGDYFLLTRTYEKNSNYYAEGVDAKGEIVTYRLKDADAKAAVDAINKPIDDLDHTGFAQYGGPTVTPDQEDPARVYPKFDWNDGTRESVNRRAVCYVGAPKTGDDGEEYYEVKSHDKGFGTCPGSPTAIGSSPSYPIELSKFGVVRNAWGDTIPDSIYRITADTKYYFVGYDSAKKKTIVSPATGADSSKSYPVTFVATKVANSKKYFDVEVLFFNRDSKVASGNLTDDFTKSTYSSGDPIFSVGLGVVKDASKEEDAMGNPQGEKVGATINKDYWSYVLEKDDSDTPEYWYLSGAFINGEWENEVMLKFDESNEGAKDWFATETVGGETYEYLKPGFYTYAYDEEDESYRLGYSAKGGLYVQAFAESSKPASGNTTFLQNVKLLDRYDDGFIFDIDTHTTTTSFWTTNTVHGRYDGMYDNNITKGYIETIRTLVNPDNYDDYIVDLVNPYGKEITTVDEIGDLIDEKYTIYVSLAYWCYGSRLLSPLFITAIVPPAGP